jgi:hypothetical protein
MVNKLLANIRRNGKFYIDIKRNLEKAKAKKAVSHMGDDEEMKDSEEFGAEGGRPKKAPKYGTSQNSARGRDPLGKETRSVNRENFIKSLDKKIKPTPKGQNLLSENNIMDDNSL